MAKRYNTWTAEIGDRFTFGGPAPVVLTVWQVLPAGSIGRSPLAGPIVCAHTKPGGLSITFDAASYYTARVFEIEDE